MADKILRGISANGSMRIFVADTTNLCREAQKIHGLYPVATAAMGRMLTAASMMGIMMKGDDDSLTMRIAGDGPLEKVVVCANSKGEVKGYTPNPHVIVPDRVKGHLNVGGAFGEGTLTVIMDMGLKEPHTAQTALVSGEVAEDITAYYAESEQIPSAVALGVLVDTDGSVIKAGGFILQLLDGATEEMALQLEDTIAHLPPVTEMMSGGLSVEDILLKVTCGFDMIMYNDTTEPKYKCRCSRKKVAGAIISLGSREIASIIEEQGEAELTCQFCNTVYKFERPELEAMLEKCIKSASPKQNKKN